MNGLRRAVRWYDGCLTASPLRTKIATSVSILSFADVARQFWGEGHDTADTFDTERTMRMAAFGGMIHAPWIHYWFNFIERQLPALPAGSPRGKLAKMAVKKMVVDQSTSAPAFHASVLAFNAALAGATFTDIQSKLRSDWWTTVKGSW